MIVASGLFGGCLYDPDERCGEHQVLEADACQCIETAVLIGNQCVPCEKDKVPGEAECVCDEGFVTSATGECLSPNGTEGQGEVCTDDSDCVETGAATCVTDAVGSYCTVTGCESYEDCLDGYACDLDGDESFCARAPTGLDETCGSTDDCSEFEASYCETALEKKCKVECKNDPGVCHGDWVCCDYTALIGAALCLSPADLSDGACPYDGELLEADQ